MNGLDYFDKLMQEEKDLIEDCIIEEYALAENHDQIPNILKQMTPQAVQKILDDWIEKEGIDPTEGSED
jgi:hypothetical protein